MEYKYNAWVHPKNGGDDYSISGVMITNGVVADAEDHALVTKTIRKNLKKEGSVILTDYKYSVVS